MTHSLGDMRDYLMLTWRYTALSYSLCDIRHDLTLICRYEYHHAHLEGS